MSGFRWALVVLASTGCYGSFRLVNTVWEFNGTVSDNIIVQEALFLGMVIVPVYEVVVVVDAVVVNTLEALTGENPVGAVTAEDGTEVVIDGHPRRLRRTARGLELQDGAKVSRAEYLADGGMVIVDAAGRRTEVSAEAIAGLQAALDRGGRDALAAELAAMVETRLAVAGP